jgi:hypothetical protein
MKEFEYYRLLLERLESQSPFDGQNEYETMKDQAERIRKGVVMWMIDNPVKAINEQNVLKRKCCMHLIRALTLLASGVQVSSSNWNMVLMALVKTLEDLYRFFIQYTGIEAGRI